VQGSFELVLVHLRAPGNISPLRFFVELRSGRFPPAPVLAAVQGPALHLHAVLGKADGSVVGGHLIEAYVRPTLEVILIQPPSYLRKRKDPETGLALIDIA
jgi:Plants and Prokaryotes Conserved (PCC) domain